MCNRSWFGVNSEQREVYLQHGLRMEHAIGLGGQGGLFLTQIAHGMRKRLGRECEVEMSMCNMSCLWNEEDECGVV